MAGTNYLGVSGTNAEARDGLFTSNRRIQFRHITDGTGHTLMVGERGFRKGALEHIDTSDDIDNLRFGSWFSAVGQRNGSVGVVLGTREVNYNTLQRHLAWERDCPPGPYRFGPPRRTRDLTGAIREECDLFQFWSYHHGGANFAYADGSVRFLSYSADPLMPAMGTRAGREVVALP